MDRKTLSYNNNEQLIISEIVSDSIPEFSIHMHDWYEIYYLISGEVDYYIEGQKYHISDNDILIINNQELHKPVFISPEHYKRMIIHFRPEYLSFFQYQEFNILDCFINRDPGHNNRIQAKYFFEYKIDHYIKKIKEAILRDVPESRILIETLLVQMLVVINNVYLKEKEVNQTHEYDPRVYRIMHFINSNLDKKITLDLLEQKLNLNKYYLCHLFKKNTGFTIIQYISYKRIMKAKELLTEGKTCVDTCYEVGFGDYANFYRLFKRIVGVSPKKFMNM